MYIRTYIYIYISLNSRIHGFMSFQMYVPIVLEQLIKR